MTWARLPLDIIENRLHLVPRPGWCTYLVTFRCNARCKMCDSWRMKPGRELTAEEAYRVFAKVGRLAIVRLTGGEPFLRADFTELAGAVERASKPRVLHITTNGSLPDATIRFAERFAAPSKLRFMVSLDGMPDEHDANRGDDVTFALARDTVRRLAALRDRLGLAVSVNHTVISTRSLEDHVRIAREFAPLAVDVQAVLAYADSAMYGLKHFGTRAADLIPATGYPLHPKLAGADAIGFVRELLRRLPRLRDPILRLGKRYYLRGLLARLCNQVDPQPHPRCVALRSHLRILPDGGVPVCQFNTEQIGNLLHEDFDAVWHGPAGRACRAWVDACPGCWAECEVMPSALYTGDLLLKAF